MDIDRLNAFVAVAELRHFGKAADRLHITQPALTKRIQALEDSLGLGLFRRDRTGTELTPAGEWLLPDAIALAAGLQAFTRRARQAAQGTRGRLNIGFGLSSIDLAPRLLARFRAQWPQVDVTLNDYASARQVELLHAGQLDLGFIRMPAPPGLEARPLRDDRLVIARAAADEAPFPADLERLNDTGFVMLLEERGPGLSRQIAQWSHVTGFTPRVIQWAEDIQTVLALVAAGIGHGIVPGSSARMFSAGLRYDAAPGAGADWTIGLVWRADRDSQALRHFVALAEAQL